MAKQVIAVDVDDVLAANAAGFVAFSNKRWGTDLRPEDYTEHWAKVWGVDEVETARRSHELHMSGAIGKYEHFPLAQPVLQTLTRSYELVVVTSRRQLISAETLAWINQYFPGIFSNVHFAGFYDGGGDRHATKLSLCQEAGASYLIDDQLKHCLAAADAGMTALLFGDYRWNRADALPSGVVRCKDWHAVQEFFRGRAN